MAWKLGDLTENNPIFRSAFESAADEYSGKGIRPVVFDILATDMQTSLLPEDLKMVLHVNPSSMKFSYTKLIERIQTKGGWVEQHWGDGTETITFAASTGGFMRLYSGLSNITGKGPSDEGYDTAFSGGGTTGSRRQTIAYDKYLDLLSLFHNNGMIYDQRGNIAFNGIVKITFDGGTHYGWFSDFSVQETAAKPYQFELAATFVVKNEVWNLRYSQESSNG